MHEAKEFLQRVARSTLADWETLEATYTLARMVIQCELPGEFVECGVYAGGQCAIMAKAIMDAGCVHRKVHLFDSFAGIPLAGPEDSEFISAGLLAGESCVSRAQVSGNMTDWGIPDDLLVYHEGLFEDTVPASGIERIAILRLDGDLYRSTKVCMEHLYPKVVRGGWCIVDDFNLSGCRQAVFETVVPAPMYWRVPTK